MSQPFSDDYDLNQQREETRVFFARKQRNNEEGNRLRIDKMCRDRKEEGVFQTRVGTVNVNEAR